MFQWKWQKMQFSPFFSVIHAKLQQSQTVAAVLPSCQVGLKLILTIFLFVKVLCKPLKKLANFQKSKHFHKKIFLVLGTIQFLVSIINIVHQWCVEHHFIKHRTKSKHHLWTSNNLEGVQLLVIKLKHPIFGFQRTSNIKPR